MFGSRGLTLFVWHRFMKCYQPSFPNILWCCPVASAWLTFEMQKQFDITFVRILSRWWHDHRLGRQCKRIWGKNSTHDLMIKLAVHILHNITVMPSQALLGFSWIWINSGNWDMVSNVDVDNGTAKSKLRYKSLGPVLTITLFRYILSNIYNNLCIKRIKNNKMCFQSNQTNKPTVIYN